MFTRVMTQPLVHTLLVVLVLLAISGCAALFPTKESQLASSGAVWFNDVCTFGGVDVEAHRHCLKRDRYTDEQIDDVFEELHHGT